jgi:hypothetical protein
MKEDLAMEDQAAQNQLPTQTQFVFERHENFETWYANNVQFFGSEWDLKMTFGELDPRDSKTVVQQHTAMSVSWLQAKLMYYYLGLNLGVYEMLNGKIKVPATTMPPEPPAPSGEFLNNPDAQRVYEFIKKFREQFLASL